MKNRIAIDLDDVLAPTGVALIDHYNDCTGRQLPYGDTTTYDYWRGQGVSDPEAVVIVQDYELAGYPGLKPFPEADIGLHRLASDGFDLAIVTARPERFRHITEAWVSRYFSGVFSDIVMTGNKYTSTTHVPEHVACAAMGALALIDDQPKHIAGVVDAGITGILFGEYPWQPNDAPKGALRARDWNDVSNHLNKCA